MMSDLFEKGYNEQRGIKDAANKKIEPCVHACKCNVRKCACTIINFVIAFKQCRIEGVKKMKVAPKGPMNNHKNFTLLHVYKHAHKYGGQKVVGGQLVCSDLISQTTDTQFEKLIKWTPANMAREN